MKSKFEIKQFPAGTVMAQEGETGREAFVIKRGTVAVVLRNGGKSTTILRSAGEVVGEMALVDAATRCASLVAESDVEAEVVTFTDFHSILNSCHPKVRSAVKSLCDLLRDSNRGVSRVRLQATLRDLRARIINQPEFADTLASCPPLVRAVVAGLLERFTG